MPLAEFSALLILSTVMSFTPGPNTTLSTALGANGGLKNALPFIFGVPFGWAVLFTLCAFGLGAVLLAAPQVLWLIKGVGCAYLLYLAFVLAKSGSLKEADASQLRVSFWQGVSLQFVNIKGWMFAISVSAGWLLGKEAFWQRFALLLFTLTLFAWVSNAVYALIGASLRQWLRTGRRLIGFNRLMASVLFLTAIWMLVA